MPGTVVSYARPFGVYGNTVWIRSAAGYLFKTSYPLPAGFAADSLFGQLRKRRYTVLGDGSGVASKSRRRTRAMDRSDSRTLPRQCR